MKLASFDIFDTTLIRRCGKPENIFYLLAERLYPQDTVLREEFLVWRRHIERRVVLPAGRNEVSLGDLYRQAEFPGYTSQELIEAELAVESAELTVNPTVQKLITERRQSGYRIAFISDMYLPGKFLAEILQREGCLLSGEMVFVSCEHQARKDRGTLYEVVRKHCQPSEWIHCGDHLHGDIRMARKHRIRAQRIDTSFTAVEQKWMDHAALQRDIYPLSILAGLARHARLSEENSPEAILAADFIASAYLPYVEFILRYARVHNVRRIYFLSRDGHILKQAAEEIAGEIECRELFVSRRSLLLPYLASEFGEKRYLQVVDRQTLLCRNVSHLLWQLNLTRRELQEQYGLDFAYERISTKVQEHDFLEKLFHSSLTPVLKARAEKQKELLLKYFQQEGLLDGTPSRMVDIGWLGTSRLMINAILDSCGAERVGTLYYGVRSDVFSSSYGSYKAFFPEGQLSTGSTVLIENYFSQSPNPSTQGYRETDGKILPIWTAGKNIQETPLLALNVRIVRQMMRSLQMYQFSSAELYVWARLSTSAISKLEGNIDLTPLLKITEFDTQSFVRKLTVIEILKIAIGKHITAFDTGSLQLTLGANLRKAIEKIRQTMIESFYSVYKNIIKK